MSVRTGASVAGAIGLVALAGLGLAACGGGRLSRPDFVKQADALCREADKVPAAAPARSAALAAERRALATVRAEASSSRLPRTYARFASAFAARVDVGAQRVAAARARDRGKLVGLSQRDGLIATTQEAPAAQRLGFEVCGV